MRALLDTNIIIHRETGKILNENIGTLFQWLDKMQYIKNVHPVTVEELKRHTDNEVVRTMGIKLDSYQLLKTVAPVHENVKKTSDKIDTTGNDKNDTLLLNEVYCSRVDLLITEDKKIHQKAKALGIEDKVFRIDSFIEKAISENPTLVDNKSLSVKKEYFGNIKIEDSFFDSFREDYEGFDNWFNRKADETSYICSYEGAINAFLFIKKEDETENYSDITPPLPPKNRLKIGTFKVTANGFKLGERFLKIIFDNALKQKVDEIYVTIFDKSEEQKRLIGLLEYWGFKFWGTKESSTGTENVYVRHFEKPADRDNPKLTFPFLSSEARVFLIPIKPEFHTELFPDSILRTESPLDFVENQPHRNAIKKVYVSHSKERDLNTGDLIVFYRTGGYYKSVITTIGIVDELFYPATLDELTNACRKRTALSDKELLNYWNLYQRKPFVVNFLYAYTLPNPFVLNLKRLIEIGVISGVDNAPRGFKEIGWDSFVKIYKEAYKR
jgi:predicted nucleic acid-binding protein